MEPSIRDVFISGIPNSVNNGDCTLIEGDADTVHSILEQ